MCLLNYTVHQAKFLNLENNFLSFNVFLSSTALALL